MRSLPVQQAMRVKEAVHQPAHLGMATVLGAQEDGYQASRGRQPREPLEQGDGQPARGLGRGGARSVS